MMKLRPFLAAVGLALLAIGCPPPVAAPCTCDSSCPEDQRCGGDIGASNRRCEVGVRLRTNPNEGCETGGGTAGGGTATAGGAGGGSAGVGGGTAGGTAGGAAGGDAGGSAGGGEAGGAAGGGVSGGGAGGGTAGGVPGPVPDGGFFVSGTITTVQPAPSDGGAVGAFQVVHAGLERLSGSCSDAGFCVYGAIQP